MATPADQCATDPGRPSALSTQTIRSIGLGAGLAAVGVTSAQILEPARSVLKLRKERGLAGAMQFTYRNPERSTDPSLLMENAHSLIAGAFRYPHAEQSKPALSGRVARYATQDYYSELELGLEAIAEKVRASGFQARVIADQNGLVDRNVAWSAGLGSYGKNANLLLPDVGSWFVLGAVVTDAKLETTGPPVADQCGPCTSCIDECPTGAIVAPGVVDATRCIAWLVQSDGALPIEFREAIGDRLYGCDECQEVCPPNRSFEKATVDPATVDPATVDTATVDTATVELPMLEDGSQPMSSSFVDLAWILSADDDDILQQHGRWYIARRDVDNIRRTALVVLGNVAAPTSEGDDQAVIQILKRYGSSANPNLRAHAVWSARRLGLEQYVPSQSTETDPTVLAEYAAEVVQRFGSQEWNRQR